MQLLRGPAFAGLVPQTTYEEATDGTRKYGSKVLPYRDTETLETVSVGEGIITVEERDLIIRQLESRTFPLAGKRHGTRQGTALLTGIARCGLCGARMSRAGTSYACSSNRRGVGCLGVTARVESLDAYVSDTCLSRLPTLEPDDDLVAIIAERWVQQEDPEVFAKRDAIQTEIGEEETRLTDLEEARCLRGEFDAAGAVDRYNKLAGRLRGRIEALGIVLAELSAPTIEISPLLDDVLLREAWEADNTAGRRKRLRLAIDSVIISKGQRGARFVGHERCNIAWADHQRPGGPGPGRSLPLQHPLGGQQ